LHIFSIKKGLEVDSSEGDYYYDYEHLYEFFEENNSIYQFLLDLYYEFENKYPDLLENLSYYVSNSELNIIKEFIKENNINYLEIFNDLFNDYWEQNHFFNEEKLRVFSEKQKTPVRILADSMTFHKDSNIFDIFRRKSPLVLFSPSIGIEIGDLMKMNSKIDLIYNKEEFELTQPIEFFSFLLLVSIYIYENENERYKIRDIFLFPVGWQLESSDFELLEELEREEIVSEIPPIGEIDTYQLLLGEESGLEIILPRFRPELELLNMNIFGNLSYLEIREYFYVKLRRFYDIVGDYMLKWLSKIEKIDIESINDFRKQIEELLRDAKELIKKRKSFDTITEEQRKEYFDLSLKIEKNPGSYFFQIYNKKELKQAKNNIEQFFHEIFLYLDRQECDKQIKRISNEIINYNNFIGNTNDAIALAINSKNYLKAAELYKQKDMMDYSFGMVYRKDKGLSFYINQDFNNTQKKAVPVIMDLYPHPKSQINIAVVQIHLSENYFEKSLDSNEFFIKEELEEEVFFYIENVIDKLRNVEVHMIIFPELVISFNPQSKYGFFKNTSHLRNLLIEDAFVKKRIIIPGTYYIGRRNIAPTIFPSTEIIYTIKQTLSNLESSVLEEISIRKGNCTPVFYTNYGRFAILICRDLLNHSLITEVLEHNPDFILNPCANKDILRFVNAASSIVENNKIYIFQPNCFSKDKIDYSTSIFSILDRKDIEILKEKNLKKDETSYGIYNSKANRNEIIVVSIELKEKRLSVPSLGSDEANIPLKLLNVIKIDNFAKQSDFMKEVW